MSLPSKEEQDYEIVLDTIDKQVVWYIERLMAECGHPVDSKGAGNILYHLGMRRLQVSLREWGNLVVVPGAGKSDNTPDGE